MSAVTDCPGILVAFIGLIAILPTRAISKSWKRAFAANKISGCGSYLSSLDGLLGRFGEVPSLCSQLACDWLYFHTFYALPNCSL